MSHNTHNNFVTLMMRVFLDSLVSYGLDPAVARSGWVVVVAADVVVSVGAADSGAAAVDDVGAAGSDAAAVDYVGAAVSVGVSVGAAVSVGVAVSVDVLGAAVSVDDVGGGAVDDVGAADSVDVTACPDGSSTRVHGFGGLLDGSRASISFDESNHDGLGI